MAFLTDGLLDFLSKIMEKAEGGTYNRTTDSNEAISEAIAGLTILTDKEKSFMGVNGQVPLNEYFGTVGQNAPDTNIWTVVEDNDASVQVFFSGGEIICSVQAGTAATNDGYMFTNLSRNYDSIAASVLPSLIFNTRIKIVDLTGEAGFGLMDSDNNTPTADTFDTAAQRHATIHCDNDVVNFSTSDGTNETTDVSAFFSVNTIVD